MCFAKSAMWANPLKTAIFTVLSSCFWSWWKMLIWLALECSTNGRRKQGLRLEPMRYMFTLRKSIPTKRAQIVYNALTMFSAPTRHRSVTKPVCAVLVRCGWCSVALSRFRARSLSRSLHRVLAMSAAGWCARVSRVRCAAVSAAACVG